MRSEILLQMKANKTMKIEEPVVLNAALEELPHLCQKIKPVWFCQSTNAIRWQLIMINLLDKEDGICREKTSLILSWMTMSTLFCSYPREAQQDNVIIALCLMLWVTLIMYWKDASRNSKPICSKPNYFLSSQTLSSFFCDQASFKDTAKIQG